ncbi:MAG TPA: MBL fold metallo-hydrolase [Thermoanaerobaculia bacterium]|nr:MBL fold metallo-hydrolase [Thermoanaerobaculia bacterium]
MDRFQIGDVSITRIVEIETPTNPRWLYAEMTPEAFDPYRSWLEPHFLAEKRGLIQMAIQSFVVESEGAKIVVDTCVGNDKARSMEFWNLLDLPFLERMSDAGHPPESIDRVLCTHLHVDHVGWNTRLEDGRWLPTFPNARYLFGRLEWEHWEAVDAGRRREHLGDSVWPIVDRGLHDLVESDHRVTSEIRLEPSPGHTPGHVSVRISSRGEEAVITGDLMHHPVQCAHPEWACVADSDPEQARATRRSFLERYSDSPVLVIGTHFATPSVGKVVRDGDRWRFHAGA